jgi:hypothetical protein
MLITRSREDLGIRHAKNRPTTRLEKNYILAQPTNQPPPLPPPPLFDFQQLSTIAANKATSFLNELKQQQ